MALHLANVPSRGFAVLRYLRRQCVTQSRWGAQWPASAGIRAIAGALLVPCIKQIKWWGIEVSPATGAHREWPIEGHGAGLVHAYSVGRLLGPQIACSKHWVHSKLSATQRLRSGRDPCAAKLAISIRSLSGEGF